MKGHSTTAYLIKERRAKLKMSQQELADKLGVNRSTVSRYESGSIEKLPIDVIIPLSKALSTTPDYLMGWSASFEDRLVMAYNCADDKTQKVVRTLLNLDE